MTFDNVKVKENFVKEMTQEKMTNLVGGNITVCNDFATCYTYALAYLGGANDLTMEVAYDYCEYVVGGDCS